jgi:hypothetical protein
MTERDVLMLRRALLDDVIIIRWSQIRCITGAPDPKTPQGQIPEIIDGACTIYLEGDLGFVVNHTQEEIFQMILEKQGVQ